MTAPPPMVVPILEGHLRRLVAPEAMVLHLRDCGGHGLVLWTKDGGEWAIHRWATHRIDNRPIEDGIMFYGGGYWLDPGAATSDYAERGLGHPDCIRAQALTEGDH